MSRLIYADKLAREYERHPDRWYFGRDVLREIGEAETVDAIPLDWLERRMNETALTDVPLNNALFTVGVEWEKAKKRGDVDG